MKKIIKIIVTVFSVFAFAFSIFSVINAIKNLSYYKDNNRFYYQVYMLKAFRHFEIYRLIFWIFCCITNILFFFVINFKDLQFVTESIIGMFKKTEEKRKENKKQRLEKDIEKKKALLEELQKDEE